MGFERYIQMHVDALDQSIADLPADRVRMHLCWGNYAGPHTADVPIERLMDMVLAAKPSAVSFEGANPRHEHEWETLAGLHIPEDKILMPGVIDTKTNVVEHPRLIAQRIGRYRGHRRPRAGHTRHRLRLRDVRRFRDRRPRGRVDEAGGAGRGRRMASERLWSRGAVTA